MAAHSNTVTQLIPIVFDFLFADDDALLTSGTDKVDIKQQGLCLSSMRRDRPRCIGYVEEVIPRYTLDDFRAIFRVGRGMFAELITLCGIQLSANHPHWGREVTCFNRENCPGFPVLHRLTGNYAENCREI